MDTGRVDVVVLTKNSERILEKCLKSIFENVPVHRLIVVDGYSTDSTLDIVKKFHEKYGNVLLLKDNGTRGSARLKGIKEVETDWFMFVDSDVTLCNGWYNKAKTFANDDVGAVWGMEVWAGMRNPVVLKLFLKITRKIFEMRGGTHDLLVRYDAIKDIPIPRDLHVFEDTFIKEWIAKKGYLLVATYDPYCIHYRPSFVWTIKGSVNLIIDAIRYGSLRKLPKLVLAYGFYAGYVIYRSLSQKLKY
ncbi:MAG: glycosyltransferase family A protein [Candidatus Bathyarchaeia archaeon]